jgi:Family of unknown function (DUF5681)
MKRPKRAPTGNYAVGYARPPKRGQFEPGTSGNPSGRRRGTKNAKTVAANVFLKRKVALTDGDTTRHVSVFEGMLLRVAERGLNKGDHRALLAALSVMQRTGLLTEQEAKAIQDSLSSEDQQLLERYFDQKGLKRS